MKHLLLLITLSLIALTSCKNKDNHDHANHKEHQHTHENDIHDDLPENAQLVEEEKQEREAAARAKEENEASAQLAVENESLHLNKGKKWTVNDATQIGMTNIKALLTDYVKNDKTDHVALATAMSIETATLIGKCDMVGRDHDMLHIILMPILESIDGIKQSKSAKPMMDLSVHLSEYFKHFQTKI